MFHKTEIIKIRELSVQLTWKSEVRMIRVRVLPPDGIIRATAPRWTSRKAVIEFLSERYEWMQKAVQKVQSRPRPTSPNYSEGEQVLLFGTPYTLHIQEVSPKEKAHVSQSYPLPFLRDIKWHLIRNTDRLRIPDLLIGRIIGRKNNSRSSQ